MNQRAGFDTLCVTEALDYAARGWAVFPVPPDTKKSHVKGANGNGARWGATTDPHLIRQYWSQWPAANVGIACGPCSELLVIEADTLEAHGKDGIGNMHRLLEVHGPLPSTIEALSPTGSWHMYFQWPREVRIGNSTDRVAIGVDVRGEGGMVVAPPSCKTGSPMRYRWNNPPGLFDLAPCPDWLLALVSGDRAPSPEPRPRRGPALHIATAVGAVDESRAGLAEVEEMLSWIDPDSAGYQSWLEVLMALHDHFEGSASGLALADGWSARGMKYRPGEVSAKWAGFKHGGGIGIGTIAQRARLHGADLSSIARHHRLRQVAPAEGNGAAFRNGGDLRPGRSQGPGDYKVKDECGETEVTLMDTGTDSRAQPVEPIPSTTDDEADLSHDALARELGACKWDRDARHVLAQGRWYLWDETRWRVDDRLQHMTLCREFLDRKARGLVSSAALKVTALEAKAAEKVLAWAHAEARSLRSANTVAAVVSLARSNPKSAARSDDFDADLMLLGTPAGAVDLRTGQLRPARRDDMITKLTSVGPAEPGTAAPGWQHFLSEVFEGDADLIAFLQRAAGYSLTGLTTEHKLLFLYGTGRNGKSTFLDMLQWLWGDYARRAAASTFLSSLGERHPTDIAGLNGARLVVGSELPKGKSWDEAVLKDLTGGDRMTARFMRGDFFDFVPQLTLMIAGNTMPSFRGVDEALRARVVLVPFTVTIPPERRDPRLGERLRLEGPAILRWAIDGALEWQKRGLDVPARVAAASTDYLDGEDTLGQFLADETVKDTAGFTLTADLHLRFRMWLERQGLSAWTSHILTKEMKSRGFEEGRRTRGRGFHGVRLTSG